MDMIVIDDSLVIDDLCYNVYNYLWSNKLVRMCDASICRELQKAKAGLPQDMDYLTNEFRDRELNQRYLDYHLKRLFEILSDEWERADRLEDYPEDIDLPFTPEIPEDSDLPEEPEEPENEEELKTVFDFIDTDLTDFDTMFYISSGKRLLACGRYFHDYILSYSDHKVKSACFDVYNNEMKLEVATCGLSGVHDKASESEGYGYEGYFNTA